MNVLVRFIPGPWDTNGPCRWSCVHYRCRNLRELAKTKCGVCGKAIGYRRYYVLRFGASPAHKECYYVPGERVIFVFAALMPEDWQLSHSLPPLGGDTGNGKDKLRREHR